jgi:ABC-type cobalamin transport system ATPase subunit
MVFLMICERSKQVKRCDIVHLVGYNKKSTLNVPQIGLLMKGEKIAMGHTNTVTYGVAKLAGKHFKT